MSDDPRLEVLRGGDDPEEREARLDAGAEALSQRGGRSLLADDRFLLTVSAALMTIGLAAILLGWAGAARSTLVEEQVPYLISGGLLGVAVATVGAVAFFAHWLTVSIREARQREVARQRDHQELMAEIRTLVQQTAPAQPSPNGRTAASARPRATRKSTRSS